MALHGERNPKHHILDEDEVEDEDEDNGNVEEEGKAKIEEDQMVIDEAVKALVEMELKQRKKKGIGRVMRKAQNTGSSLISGRWSRIGKNKKSMKPKERVLSRLLTN